MVMHWQYVSICRGGKAILEKISEAGIDPDKYITFYSLRGYDKIDKIHNEVKTINSRASLSKGEKQRLSEEPNSGVQLDKNPSVALQNDNNYLEGELNKSPTELQAPETFDDGSGNGRESKESPIRHPLEDSFSDEKAETSPKDRIGGEPVIPSGMEQMDPRKTYVTEEIYIHSKLMIVDDRYVICGSGRTNWKFS
jgi:phospholipase D1/2